MKFRPKFSWEWSFFDQNQQPLKSVEPFERILRALFIAQCPYKFSSFLDLRNASNRFRLFSPDFRLLRFFFPGSACFWTLASPRNLPNWVKYDGKFESFGKEFWFIAVERVRFWIANYTQELSMRWIRVWQCRKCNLRFPINWVKFIPCYENLIQIRERRKCEESIFRARPFYHIKKGGRFSDIIECRFHGLVGGDGSKPTL